MAKLQSGTRIYGSATIDTDLSIGSGTVTAPSIYPTGDNNTGIFFPAVDTIAFTEGGVEAMRIDSGGNLLLSTNIFYRYQPAPTSKAAAATLTGAELLTGILNTTGTTYTITVPTGTNIDAAVSSSLGVNGSFDWWVINSASGTITIGANGNTTMGTLTVLTGISACFRFRKTAANTYTIYRIN